VSLIALTPSLVIATIAAAISLGLLVVSILAFRRTSRLQDADYFPHIVFNHDELRGITDVNVDLDEDDQQAYLLGNIEYSGTIANVGVKPVHLIKLRVLLGPKRRDDPDCAMTIPIRRTIPAGGENKVGLELQWATICSVARRFHSTAIEFLVVLTFQGADGVTRERQQVMLLL
jgi:hypothetical protein